MSESELALIIEKLFWGYLGLAVLEILFVWGVMTVHEILDYLELRKQRKERGKMR
jgi:hypothetical protein